MSITYTLRYILWVIARHTIFSYGLSCCYRDCLCALLFLEDAFPVMHYIKFILPVHVWSLIWIYSNDRNITKDDYGKKCNNVAADNIFSYQNYKLRLCTCAKNTRTKCQIEILTIEVISGIVYFCEIVSRSLLYRHIDYAGETVRCFQRQMLSLRCAWPGSRNDPPYKYTSPFNLSRSIRPNHLTRASLLPAYLITGQSIAYVGLCLNKFL